MARRNQQIYQFDNFRLDAAERQLLRDGVPVTLPSKAFELLLLLVENRGRLIEKEELYQRVWADQIVEESNLTVQMSAIRKALGEQKQNPRYIATVAGHGYRFIGDVAQLAEELDVSVETQAVTRIVIETEDKVEAADTSTSGARPLLTVDDLPETSVAARSANLGQMEAIHKADSAHRILISSRTVIITVTAVTIVVAVSLTVYYLASRATAPASYAPVNRIKSIAVLPFQPLVANDRNESLELGMADTLITRLSNAREINVRPISTVRKYARLDQDTVAAGREQKVDAVVAGHMQRSGEKIRVTVSLVRIEDGLTLWTSQFDEKMTDILQVQDAISERVAEALSLRLSGNEKERLTKHHTENTEAYQLYMMGRYHLNRLTDEGFLKALEYFHRAIDKDPNFGLAYSGVADTYNALGGFNVRPPREVYPEARSAAMTALKLDPMLAQAHTNLAMVNLAFDWDWTGAEAEFKRAIEISPSDSDAHYYYSLYFAFMGKSDLAIAESKRALELDPVSTVKLTGLAQVLIMAHRYDEGLEECRKALEMDPNLGFAHWLRGLAYMYNGSYEQAIVALQKSIPLSGDSPDEPACLARAYALSGKTAEARKILEQLKVQAESRYISPIVIADVYCALGEKDKAFALYDKAYEQRDNMMVLLKAEPMFDLIRSDPRFIKLMQRVGFPP